jgi:ligand-binding sensor protein
MVLADTFAEATSVAKIVVDFKNVFIVTTFCFATWQS